MAAIAGRSYGPEHRDTLAARHNLAYSTGEAGDTARARDQLAALLPTRERVLGPEHPDTLITRNQHARCIRRSAAAPRRRHRRLAGRPGHRGRDRVESSGRLPLLRYVTAVRPEGQAAP